jgi:hypothetical protein
VGKISIDEAPDWIRKLAGDRLKAAERGLFAAALHTVEVIQTEIIPAEPRIPVDRGIYKAGWRAKKIPRGAMVYNRTPHAVIIEHGARAENIKIGRAMIDALAGWVIRKGLTGAAKGAEKHAEGRRIAWAIAQSMKKKGIFNEGNGLKILEKARKRIPEFIVEEVTRELEKVGKE